MIVLLHERVWRRIYKSPQGMISMAFTVTVHGLETPEMFPWGYIRNTQTLRDYD